MRNKLILLLSLSALGFSLSSIASPFSRRNCCCQTEEVQEVVEREVMEKCDGETNSAGICLPEREEAVIETRPVYVERPQVQEVIEKCDGEVNSAGICIPKREEAVVQKCDGEINSAGICIPKREETVVETKPVYTETKPVVYTETTKEEVIKDSTNYHRGLW